MNRGALSHRVIAIEEHFVDEAFASHFPPGAAGQPPKIAERIYDLMDVRIREMDEAGIDMQVLSHQSPGGQRLKPDAAVEACRAVNDRLAAVIAEKPDRFSGFAMLPTIHPDAAADELQRSVEELGLKGAMIHGPTKGRFIDEPEFRPIFARAAALDVPIYLHPSKPDDGVTETYYGTYAESHPAFTRSAWGFGVETGTQGARMVLSGVFDDHPDLKIILGHLGEGLPFFLWRLNSGLSRPNNRPSNFAEVFRRNFWITTSGFFSDPALRCCLEEMGEDRVLFAIDWPYESNTQGVDWLAGSGFDAKTKERIFCGNAEALLKL